MFWKNRESQSDDVVLPPSSLKCIENVLSPTSDYLNQYPLVGKNSLLSPNRAAFPYKEVESSDYLKKLQENEGNKVVFA